ncbi:DUF5000 domain-containing lipoprotein [Chitinophaga lutea]|nr:DUF5000 domain-containing lipoprotein [Chitinophaga lutea]
MNRHHILVLLLGLFLWSSCKEKNMLLYTDDNAPAPKPVSNVQFIRTPGGSKLYYKVPADNNLLYVKAVYDISQGVTRETKTSIHQDTLVLEGYADTLEHEVKVYTVGKNKKESDPVTLKIRPLTAPVHNLFKTIEMKETFGGASITFQNKDEAALAIVMIYDSTGQGDWAEADTYHSKAPKGAFSVRGFDTIPVKFATYVRDRWNNKSDTLALTLKPLFETKLDRTLMKEVSLPTDENIGHVFSGLSPRNINFMFNNVFGTGSTNDCFHTRPAAAKMPQWFTFDLGQQYNLSRFKFYHRGGSSGYYRGADPKRFEIYGSNSPNADGSWDSWTLLGTFTSFKPSGDAATPTKEDEEFAVTNGEDFDFPPGTPPMRYLRWKTTETWGNSQYIYIAELMFWGAKL